MNFEDFQKDKKIYNNGYEKNTPKISIITPTYCRLAKGLLEKCIKSVLCQTYENFEFIIVDDASEDGSAELIRKHAEKDDRIVYIRHDINSGFPSVRTNEGILFSRGEYISFVFDDNVLEPEFLESLLASAEKNHTDIQYSKTKIIGTPDQHMGISPVIDMVILNHNLIANGSVLCKRSLFQKIGLYDPHIMVKRICDWDLWIRAYKTGCTFTFVNQVLSTEYGVSSPNSLGNTINLDYKISYAYITDITTINKRNEMLSFDNINKYNLLDMSAVLPYVRNHYELMNFERDVYSPYYKDHHEILNNETTANSLFSLSNEINLIPFLESAEVSNRPRILIFSALYNSKIDELVNYAKKQNPLAIIIVCSPSNIDEFKFDDIDLFLIVDYTDINIINKVNNFKLKGIPVGFVLFYGCSTNNKDYVISESMEIFRNNILSADDLYFPEKGNPWSSVEENKAKQIFRYVDFIINGSDCESPEILSQEEYVQLHNIAHLDLFKWALLIKNLKGKKCYVFINSRIVAGSELYGIILAQIIKGYNIDVEICVPNNIFYDSSDADLVEYVIKKGLRKPIKLDYQTGPYFNDINFKLIETLEENNVGLVVCSSLIADIAAAARDANIPSLFSLFSPANYRTYELGILKQNLSGVISDCQWTCDLYNEAYSLDCTKIIDYIENDVYKPFSIKDKELINIAIVGTVQPRKRQLQAVQACHTLINEGYKIKLNIYGYKNLFKDYTDLICEYIESNNLSNSIEIKGFVKNEEEIKLCNDIILMTSIEESLPQSVLFNMASGLLAVSTPVGGICEIIVDGKTGFLASSFDTDSIIQALIRALEQQEKWEDIVCSAQEFLKQECSWNEISNKLLSYLSTKVEVAKKVFKSNDNSYHVAKIKNKLNKSYNLEKSRNTRPIVDISKLVPSRKIKTKKTYYIGIDQEAFSTLSVFIGTHMKDCSGKITMNLKSTENKNYTIRSSQLDLEILKDNDWVDFRFDILFNNNKGRYIVEFFLEYKNTNFLSIYEIKSKNENRILKLIRNRNNLFFKVL